nr:retrovirus-related Pol polyprotein from transposon TNT 1-94 [Tanacetum cinerariifolium]
MNTSTPTEMLKGLDKQLERKEDGGLYLDERIWVPVYGNLRTLIMNEAHATRQATWTRDCPRDYRQDCSTKGKIEEAEYVSLSACYAQVLCMRTQLTDYSLHFDKIPMYCDSKAAISISCNPVQHSHTKHIDVRYHFIKEKVEKGIIELFFVRTEYQLADLFTKTLLVERFQYLVRRLGMRCLTPAELEALANESA